MKARVKVNDLIQADTNTNDEEDTLKLPAKILSELTKTVAKLPSYPPYTGAVHNALDNALQKWHDDMDAPNSLVILGSPVLPLTEIMNHAIAHWEPKESLEVRSLNLSTHRHDFQHIQDLVEHKLPDGAESSEMGEISASSDILKDRKFVMVVPQLDWCFLRCIEGLDSIEYLRNLVFKNTSMFWLIGCNTWAWRYLEFIFKVSAYFGKAVNLPDAEADELQAWLEPAIEKIQVQFPESLSDEKIAEIQQDYFKKIAELSSGISSVAAGLWLGSLSYELTENTEETEQTEASEAPEYTKDQKSTELTEPFEVVQNKPKLPDLPKLSPEDRYILYSLLLHGGMGLSELALSLGQAESPVKARVQFLLQSDAIDRHYDLLVVNPAYYPRLKTVLYSNNFLVGE